MKWRGAFAFRPAPVRESPATHLRASVLRGFPMQKKILAALVAGLVAIIPAYAAKKSGPANIDFGAYTCEQLIQEAANSSAEDMGAVLMWLDGYLSGVSGDSELNWKDLEKFSANLVTYCGNKPNEKVLNAAEAVGISK